MGQASGKKALFFNYLFLLLRVILGAVFIFYAISKFLDIASFRWALVNIQLFYWTASGVLSYAVPLTELVLGILLLIGLFRKFVLIHMSLYILVLVWISYFAWNHSSLQDCNCLGKLIRLQYGIPQLILLGVMFLVTVLLFFDKGQLWSVDTPIKRYKEANGS